MSRLADIIRERIRKEFAEPGMEISKVHLRQDQLIRYIGDAVDQIVAEAIAKAGEQGSC